MRILFVSLAVPFPPTNGHRIRNWTLLRALAEEKHQVTLVSFADAGELDGNNDGLKQTCLNVTLVPLPESNGAGRYGGRLRAMGSLLPYGVWRFQSEALKKAVQDHLARDRFDAVVCDDIYVAGNLTPSASGRILLNKHDITHIILKRYLMYESNPFKRVYGWAEFWKLRRWEKRVCSSLSCVLACSDIDRELLEVLCPRAQVMVIPNVIDTGDYTPVEAANDKTVLYVGAMDWYPNQDAVVFFAAEILPQIRRLIPGVKFRVAGRSPSGKLRQYLARVPGVEVTGTVPDMRAEIAKAAVCVVPLRIGSGTRLKILEAGAMAKPVVSTRLGAEGLYFVDGEEIVLADEPRAFARAVAEVVSDASLRQRLGQAARRRVEAQYSLPVLREKLQNALTQMPVRQGRIEASDIY